MLRGLKKKSKELARACEGIRGFRRARESLIEETLRKLDRREFKREQKWEQKREQKRDQKKAQKCA